MNKPAPTDHPLIDLIRNRWSVHAFDPARSVPLPTLLSLLEAARWAPSSYNEQPWAFTVARREDTESFQRLLSCLVPGNEVWAKNAAVLIITAAKMNFEKSGKVNRCAMHDVGAAAAWLTVQAESMGLRVHQMAGIDIETCRTSLGIPPGWEPCTGIAIGWHGDPAQLPDALKARETAPRARKPLRELAFAGSWGKPLL